LQDLRLDAAGQGALAAGLALLPGEEPPAFREVLYAGGTSALRELLSVCTVSQDAVVWDSEDRPSRLSEYLDRL
jgi:hypothetical protein